MAIISFNDIAGKINLMPINGVRICKHGHDVEDVIYIHNIEAESSYNISPITRQKHSGVNKTLGYKVNATVYVPYNSIAHVSADEANLLRELENIWSEGVLYYHFILMLGSYSMGSPESGYINTGDEGMWIELTDPELNIEIESVEYRPRLIIKVNHFTRTLSGILL